MCYEIKRIIHLFGEDMPEAF